MRNINSKDKRTTMSLKIPNSSYMHLYLIFLTFLSIIKPAEGCPPGKYYYYSGRNRCGACQPGRYKSYSSPYGPSCNQLCDAGKYSRYVSYTSTCAPTITATHMLNLAVVEHDS